MAYAQELHDTVYRELMLEFNQNTILLTDESADNELRIYLELKIFPLLNDHRIEWGGRARKFIRACAAALARASQKCVAPEEPQIITRKAIVMALKGNPKEPTDHGLIPYWERICPLPAAVTNSGPMPLVCCAMRAHLGMELTSEVCLQFMRETSEASPPA